MEAEYIKKEDVLNLNVGMWVSEGLSSTEAANMAIKNFKEFVKQIDHADVVEQKHGEWIPIPDKDAPYYEKSDWIGCSECRQYAHYTRISDKPILSNFCPNCGARMESGDGNV